MLGIERNTSEKLLDGLQLVSIHAPGRVLRENSAVHLKVRAARHLLDDAANLFGFGAVGRPIGLQPATLAVVKDEGFPFRPTSMYSCAIRK